VSYLVANTPVGSRVPLEIIRAGKRATVTVTVGQRPTEEQLAALSGGNSGTQGNDTGTAPAAGATRTLGLSLAPLTPELARAVSLPANAKGVIITSVDPNGDAADEGLQRGDLIVSVNNQLVTTPAQVVAAVESARKAGRSSVLLLVKRGNAPEAFVGVDISGK
jgi:serine protease Do